MDGLEFYALPTAMSRLPAAVDIDATAHLGIDALTWLASLLPESAQRQATRPTVPTTRPAAENRTVTNAAIGASR